MIFVNFIISMLIIINIFLFFIYQVEKANLKWSIENLKKYDSVKSYLKGIEDPKQYSSRAEIVKR